MLAVNDLVTRYNLKRNGRRWEGDCPVCGYVKGFVVEEGRKKPIIQCHGGCDRDTLLSAIFEGSDPIPAREPAPPETTSGGKAAAMRFLHVCRPAEGTIVVPYLRSRLLEVGARAVRTWRRPATRQDSDCLAWSQCWSMSTGIGSRFTGLSLRPAAPARPLLTRCE